MVYEFVGEMCNDGNEAEKSAAAIAASFRDNLFDEVDKVYPPPEITKVKIDKPIAGAAAHLQPAKFTSTDMASVLAAQKAVVEQDLHEKHSEELKKAPGITYDFTYWDQVGMIKGQDNMVNKLITMPVASPSYVQINFPSTGEGVDVRRR